MLPLCMVRTTPVAENLCVLILFFMLLFIQWLNLGDKKTKFFFKTMKKHHSGSKIVLVCRENGTRIEDPNEVKAKIVGYFLKLLEETSYTLSLISRPLGRFLLKD